MPVELGPTATEVTRRESGRLPVATPSVGGTGSIDARRRWVLTSFSDASLRFDMEKSPLTDTVVAAQDSVPAAAKVPSDCGDA